MQTLAIIGASTAGVALASRMRDQGYDGKINLFDFDTNLPYHRPPLSKDILETAQTNFPLKGPNFYQENDIELILGNSVERVRPEFNEIELSNGTRFNYDCLALTTGSRARQLDGLSGGNVLTLRSARDAIQLKQQAAEASRVVIIGGGFIGLELAARLVSPERDVVLIERQNEVLCRSSSKFVASQARRALEEKGVKFHLGVSIERVDYSNGNVKAVVLSEQPPINCNLVIVAVGSIANDELARNAGLAVDDGILVDNNCKVVGTNIVAAGDCARFSCKFADNQFVRLESVQNAVDQARVAADTLVGHQRSYDNVPWFWSDQCDVKIQIAGIINNSDQKVVRGETENRKFSVFHYSKGVLVGVESVNRPGDHMLGRYCLTNGVSLGQDAAKDNSVTLAIMKKKSLGNGIP